MYVASSRYFHMQLIQLLLDEKQAETQTPFKIAPLKG